MFQSPVLYEEGSQRSGQEPENLGINFCVILEKGAKILTSCIIKGTQQKAELA